MSDKKAEELNKETEETQETEITEEELESSIGTEIDEVEHKVLELEKEVSTLKDLHLRKVAELDNMRKRMQRERSQVFQDAKAGALEDFLPISDDLKRTLEAAEGLDIDKNFLAGVEMVSKKFEEILGRHGVSRIDEANVPFDVNLHDAMMRQPAPDEKTGSDVVLQVLESGYRIGDRTIRHAKVIVSE
jgi:molecular chaperone GrpE